MGQSALSTVKGNSAEMDRARPVPTPAKGLSYDEKIPNCPSFSTV
jgi:hypothetical protein